MRGNSTLKIGNKVNLAPFHTLPRYMDPLAHFLTLYHTLPLSLPYILFSHSPPHMDPLTPFLTIYPLFTLPLYGPSCPFPYHLVLFLTLYPLSPHSPPLWTLTCLWNVVPHVSFLNFLHLS